MLHNKNNRPAKHGPTLLKGLKPMKKWLLILPSLFAISALAAGCGYEEPATVTNLPKPPAHSHSHSHGDEDAGPHDGTVAEWGDKHHVEFTVDHDKQEATVFILGEDEKTAAPIKAETIQLTIIDPAMEVTLKASPQPGDAEGSSSRFVGNHKSLGIVQEYAGAIKGEVDGATHSGNFKEEPHGHSHE